MDEEKIVIEAKRKPQNKKPARLMETLSGLGFTKVRQAGQDVIAERLLGEESGGKRALLDYRINFGKESIEFSFTVQPKESKKKRLFVLFPVFLNAALLAEGGYDIKVSTLFNQVSSFLNDVYKVADKDAIDLSTELEEIRAKYSDLSKRYAELVRSSEENARLLLECERGRDELHQRTHELEKLSDDILKEELYKWIRIHEGSIDLEDFCKAYSMPLKRCEEGLDMLVREGYIKRRSE